MTINRPSGTQGLVCGHLRPSSELLGYSQVSLWDKELWVNHRRSRQVVGDSSSRNRTTQFSYDIKISPASTPAIAWNPPDATVSPSWVTVR